MHLSSQLYINADHSLSETAIDEYALQLINEQLSTQHMQKQTRATPKRPKQITNESG